MNKLQEAKYIMYMSDDYHRYFALDQQYKKNTDVVKICFAKYHDSAKKISSIFNEYLKYHDLTEQGSLELIIMLKNILTEQQKTALRFDLYDEIIDSIVKHTEFEDLYNKYKNKTVLHFLLDKHLDLLFKAFKVDRTSPDTMILDIMNNINPVLGAYLNEHKNLLNKFIKPQEKKLTK